MQHRRHPAMQQQDLFQNDSPYTPQQLHGFLSDNGALPLRLSVTRNRVSMLSVSFPRDNGAIVRLQEAYLAAPPTVLSALRLFLRTRRKEHWRLAAEFARSIRATPSTVRRQPPPTRGHIYDLSELRDTVNRRFFASRLKCRIGWSRRSPQRLRRAHSIRFGTYRKDENLVLVNPRLDQADVPREFVEYIVFHEMLHAAVPSVRRNGRWNHHPPEYRRFERQFPDWAHMQEISTQLLG